MLVKCMFSGSGGQGSALMAKLVCEGAMRENLKVVMTQTYGIEQRGGDSTSSSFPTKPSAAPLWRMTPPSPWR